MVGWQSPNLDPLAWHRSSNSCLLSPVRLGQDDCSDRQVGSSLRETVRALAREVDDTVGGFVRGQSALCLSLGVFYAVVLWLLGLKHGALIGFAAGLLSFIPYLGSLSGLLIATSVAVAQLWP